MLIKSTLSETSSTTALFMHPRKSFLPSCTKSSFNFTFQLRWLDNFLSWVTQRKLFWHIILPYRDRIKIVSTYRCKKTSGWMKDGKFHIKIIIVVIRAMKSFQFRGFFYKIRNYFIKFNKLATFQSRKYNFLILIHIVLHNYNIKFKFYNNQFQLLLSIIIEISGVSK